LHPRKKNRSFASGKLSVLLGMMLVPVLIGISISIGAIVGNDFLVVMLFYFLLTAYYSLVLKRVILLDCLTLAALYTLRIIAGAIAISVSLSFWLLAFSIFIFFSLALVKRYAELVVQMQEGKSSVHGRGYLVSDAPLLQTIGVSSGFISALVIALYVRSEDVIFLYTQPFAILLVLPILLYWVSWVWLKAKRGEMHDDPIIFAVKDKTSLLVALLLAFVYIYATVGVVF